MTTIPLPTPLPHRNADTWLLWANAPTTIGDPTGATREIWDGAPPSSMELASLATGGEIQAIGTNPILVQLIQKAEASPASYRAMLATLLDKGILSQATHDAVAALVETKVTIAPVLLETGPSIAEQTLGRPATRADIEAALETLA